MSYCKYLFYYKYYYSSRKAKFSAPKTGQTQKEPGWSPPDIFHRKPLHAFCEKHTEKPTELLGTAADLEQLPNFPAAISPFCLLQHFLF